MAIFDKEKPRVFREEDGANTEKASLSKSLSVVGFDEEEKFFYITVDRLLFSNPVDTIRTVLDAHGFVANLENILSCLDSFTFSVYGKTTTKAGANGSSAKISEYLPCVRFELPRKDKVGDTLQNFYDEIAKYQSKTKDPAATSWSLNPDVRKNKELARQVKALTQENKELSEQVSTLTYLLNKEQKSLSRASRALDSQRVLPDNTRICRVEQVDLKRRIVKVKCQRSAFDIPTHMLDRVPEFQARCLVAFDEGENIPRGIIFFDSEELGSLERRTAELLYVEGDTFKARDSMRNEFQIQAVNAMEADTIKSLSRGMQVVISIADGYVVRFSVLGSISSEQFLNRVQEQFIVYDIGRNQLVRRPPTDFTVD